MILKDVILTLMTLAALCIRSLLDYTQYQIRLPIFLGKITLLDIIQQGKIENMPSLDTENYVPPGLETMDQ